MINATNKLNMLTKFFKHYDAFLYEIFSNAYAVKKDRDLLLVFPERYKKYEKLILKGLKEYKIRDHSCEIKWACCSDMEKEIETYILSRKSFLDELNNIRKEERVMAHEEIQYLAAHQAISLTEEVK